MVKTEFCLAVAQRLTTSDLLLRLTSTPGGPVAYLKDFRLERSRGLLNREQTIAIALLSGGMLH